MTIVHRNKRFQTVKLLISLCCLLSFGAMSGYSAGNQEDIPITILSSTTFFIAADISSLTLDFSDFISGSVSESVTVNYTVLANGARASKNIISAGLDEVFQGVQLEARFGTYVDNGGNAVLTAINPNFVPIGTASQGLADKEKFHANGRLISGTFPITYQARATQDLEAGSQFRILTITFIDQ